MVKITIGFAVALIALGLGGFLSSGAKTALIPAYEGVLLLVAGLVALNPAYRMHAMHGAVMVGLLGFLLAGGRLIAALAKGNPPSTLGFISLGGMALISLIFVVFCVRSFISARRNRLAQG